MKRQSHLLLIVLVTGMVLVSCQRQAAVDEQIATESAQLASPEPAPLQACDLIEKSTLEELVGATLLEPKQSTIYSDGQTLSQGCLYLAADNAYTPTIQVDLQSPIAAPLTDTWLAVQSSNSANPRYQELELPGAQLAYQSDRGLALLLDGYGIMVVVSMPESAKNSITAQRIAEQILSNWTATPSANLQ